MPQENSDSLALLERVLRLESSTGYADLAAEGGLEAFAARHAPNASAALSGYAMASPNERKAMVVRARRALGGADASPPVGSRAVSRLPGVGPKRAALLERLGIRTVDDLLRYLPRRLEDRGRFLPIGQIVAGQDAAVRGTVLAISQQHLRRQMSMIKAVLGDTTGFLSLVWFNQPWVANQLRRGDSIDVFGRPERKFREWQMSSPLFEPSGTCMDVGRVVPVYPATEGLSDRVLRGMISRAVDEHLEDVIDPLPPEVRAEERLPSEIEALRAVHRPTSREDFERARRSLAFEELLLLQLGLLLTTRDRAGTPHAGSTQLANSLLASLPFTLTDAQRRVLREIRADLAAPTRMMRLLQGDVGSGKTLVATAAALHVVDAGFQVALMAPTEILAEQHAASLARLLGGLPVCVGLLTGSSAEREETRRGIEQGDIHLAVGTHALIEEAVAFRRLGLVVIDEQHRFGVVQRSAIEEKGEQVDLLVMSATPIPRTIALTLYGEFDVSILDEFPTGAKRTTTHWLPEARREDALQRIAEFLAAGRRGYVVVPLVEESEKVDARAAVQVHEELRARFPRVSVGLLHGRLPAPEKAGTMERFRTGDIQLLVATTVVEVGVDVLEADFMLIEHADRFGLSQLHQLRGRIGRAGQPADCLAVADARTEEAQRRLSAFRDTSDGFAIAEEDLRIRGPGDLLGTDQHGFLTQLRAVDLATDLDLMQRAQVAARRLRDHVPEVTLHEVDRRFAEVIRWLRV
ncbi:MAG: ATP-dependent DNA helicase RecG [Candidatus Bipolaricaulota bacterium]